MRRLVEPELMDDPEQAKVYTAADFEKPHRMIVEMFGVFFPDAEIKGHILDLGCGPGDITFRFASKFPDSVVTGVDGSTAMIELAKARVGREGLIGNRVNFVEGLLPGAVIQQITYDAVVSNSLLHHLHDPDVLWEIIKKYSSTGTKIYIVDLFRPVNEAEAKRLIAEYAGNEPEILQKDFYNSLLAAFEIGEVKEQLVKVGLSGLSVDVISDRHMVIYGEL